MPSPKKIIASVVLVAVAGMAAPKAQPSLVDFFLEWKAINWLLNGLLNGVAWVVDKVAPDPADPADNPPRQLKNLKVAYKKVTIPDVKRYDNFIVIKNLSQGKWTFQVSNLTPEEKAAKFDGASETLGTVSVYRSREFNKDIPLNQMQDLPKKIGDRKTFLERMGDPLEAGGRKVALEKDVDYIISPNPVTVKSWGRTHDQNFWRTVYLEDANGNQYAFNLVKPADKPVTFGVTLHSAAALTINKGLEMDLKPKSDYRDMFFIMQDTIKTPPKERN